MGVPLVGNWSAFNGVAPTTRRRGLDPATVAADLGSTVLWVPPLYMHVCVCLYVRRPVTPSPAPATADLGGGGGVVAPAPSLSLCVWRAAVVACGGGGVVARRRWRAVAAFGGSRPRWPLRLFLFQKIPSPRAIVGSRRTCTERGTHGYRRRGLRRLHSAESASPRVNSP
jgi:hypothetical protein